MINLKNKTILITGGSGSLGNALTERFLALKNRPKKIIIFSRSEAGQQSMRINFSNYFLVSSVEFVLGSVVDLPMVAEVVAGSDIVIHAAAFKFLDLAEIQPRETCLSNILGTINVLDTVKQNKKVEQCIGISTDKVSYARNVYGCTKQIMEKLFLEAANSRSRGRTKFKLVRYGNVIGTTGSVIPIWLNLRKQGRNLGITNRKMRRYMFTLKEAVDVVMYCLSNKAKNGENVIKSLRVAYLKDVAKVIAGNKVKVIDIPMRPGEKLDECLIADYELPYLHYRDKYLILNNKKVLKVKKQAMTTADGPFMTQKEIRDLLNKLYSLNL